MHCKQQQKKSLICLFLLIFSSSSSVASEKGERYYIGLSFKAAMVKYWRCVTQSKYKYCEIYQQLIETGEETIHFANALKCTNIEIRCLLYRFV